MPADAVPLLIAIIALVLLSGFFSSTETAYSCASRIKLRSLATNGNKRAEKTLNLAEEKFDTLISTILVGNNIVNITASTLATLMFAKIMESSTVDSSLISTIVMTVAVLLFGEITPKFIAKSTPEKYAMAIYPIITFFYYLLYPINMFFSGWKWLITKIFRIKEADVITEEEIMTVVEEAEEDGTLKEDETKLIRSVIEFDDLEVCDIFVPRVNIVAVEIGTSMEDIKKVFSTEGYSRIPVYKDSIDTIIGWIHEKDFFKAYLAGKKGIDGIMKNAFYTTEHTKISSLLRQLQKKKIHMAIVLDEYGGTLGLVTFEDILEELVGEIYDEHDEEVHFFKQISDNEFIVDGNANLDDFFEFFNMKDEDEQFESNTLSGWVIEQVEEIPSVGTKLTYKTMQIEIMKATIRRVLSIKVRIEPQEKTEEE